MGDFLNLRNRVKRNLGNPTDSDTLSAIDNNINYILTKKLADDGLLPFLTEISLSTTASQGYVDLTTGFRKFKDGLFFIDTGGGSWIQLKVLKPESLSLSDEGTPSHFMIGYNSSTEKLMAWLRPIPNAVYSLKGWAFVAESALSLDADESILSKIYDDRVIEAGATYVTALSLRRDDDATLWGGIYRRALNELLEWQGDIEGEQDDERPIYL